MPFMGFSLACSVANESEKSNLKGMISRHHSDLGRARHDNNSSRHFGRLKLIDGTSEGLKFIVVGWFKKLGFDETFPRNRVLQNLK